MKEKIFDYIRRNSNKVTFKNLKLQFGLYDDNLEKILHELKLDGKIIQVSNKYSLFPEDNYIGEVGITYTGNKIVFYNGGKLNVPSNFFDKLVLHDVVSFKIIKNDSNGIANPGMALITSIIDRPLGNTTCEVTVNNKGKKKIICYRNNTDINLPDEVIDELNNGDVILVNTGIVDEDGFCKSAFVKKIGNRNDPNMDEVATAYNYGFDNEYSEEYMLELSKLPTSVSEEELVGREDYRDCKVFTIDGANTKDMDDALHVSMDTSDDIITVYVHISDVSNYIKFKSAIFDRAYEKGTSLYENNSVFHMFHPIISNGICSLNPNEDRLTKTIMMRINKDGEIIDFNILKSVINSKLKMTYDDVDKVLSESSIPDGYENFTTEIKLLYEASRRIKSKYEENGKIDIVSRELEKKYDKNNNVTEVSDAKTTPATELIEYLMVAANRTVAEYIFWSSVPGAYRIHEVPDVVSVNKAIEIINTLGYKIRPVTNVDDPKILQKIIKKLTSSSEFPILSSIILQFMQRARYSTTNSGHYALGEEYYCHFTSPIRRLPDLLNHMILDFLLKNEDIINDDILKNMEDTLEKMCSHASYMERQADAAEYEAEQKAIIKSMEQYRGEEYEAVVLEVKPRVKIRVNGVTCFLSDKDFMDYFKFDNHGKYFYDKDSNLALKIGSKLVVKLIDANHINQSIVVKPLGIIDPKILTKCK